MTSTRCVLVLPFSSKASSRRVERDDGYAVEARRRRRRAIRLPCPSIPVEAGFIGTIVPAEAGMRYAEHDWCLPGLAVANLAGLSGVGRAGREEVLALLRRIEEALR